MYCVYTSLKKIKIQWLATLLINKLGFLNGMPQK